MDESPSKRRRKTKFKEISTTLSKEELVRRLKTAAQELSNVDQEDSTSDFDEFAASLATSFLLNNRDKDVKSYCACCLVDILRIYAPEPPYNEDQLKDIFRMLLKQLKGLESLHGPAYKRHFYVLESLALVKTFNVCNEIDAQDVILDLFKLFFTIVSDQHNVRVTNFMLDIMCPLIQEGGTLPQEVLDVILIHLIEPRKSKYSASYHLSCNLLDKCSSSIEPYIQLFFNNSLVLGNDVTTDLEDHLYDLLFELYKINRNVLLSVLPQLEFKLKGNDESARFKTVKLLGQMFSHENFSLAERNTVLWNCYLGRFLDISTDIRVECVQMSKQFLLSPVSRLRSDISDHLNNRLLDPDEKVRLETVMTVCEAAGENFSYIPQNLFHTAIERMRDKKWSIRRETMTCMGKLYKKLFSCKSKHRYSKEISSLPSKVLHLYQNTIEDRLCVERIIHGCFIPVSLEVEEKMKRFLNVYLSLDETAMKIFDGMLRFRSKVNRDLCGLLEAYKDDTIEDKEKRMFSKTIAVAKNLPDPHKVQEHIKKLLTYCADKKFLELFLTCIDVQQDCPTIIKAVTEIIKKLTSKSPILETVKALLDRGCPMLIDKAGVVILLNAIKRCIDGLPFDKSNEEEDDEDHGLLEKGKTGLKLLRNLANIQPHMFQTKPCYEILLAFVKHDTDEVVVEHALTVLVNIISGLEAVDKTFFGAYQTELNKLVTNGTCKQAKYAVRCLKYMLKDSSLPIERILKNLIETMTYDSSLYQLRTTLSALGEIALQLPDMFETKYEEIIKEFVVKEVLMFDREDTRESSSQDSEESEWCSKLEISAHTSVKIQGIKLMTKWLLGLPSFHSGRVIPVFRLFATMLSNDGDLKLRNKTSAPNRSHLRVATGMAFLKLLQKNIYAEAITLEQYQQLAFLIQDSCYEVREIFTRKLNEYLETFALPLPYMAYFTLVAADPVKDRKAKVKQMIARNAQSRRDFSKQHSAAASRPYNILPEYSLSFVVHLLAHHPDFNHKDFDSLRQTKEYLWFFLEPIMGPKAENYSFLKKLLETIKQTKDKQDPSNEITNEKMYAVCDLAVGCIMSKTSTFTLKEFPGNPVLPKKLFIAEKGLHNTKSFLPQGFLISPKKPKSFLESKNLKDQKDITLSKSPKKKSIPNKRSNTCADDNVEEEKSPKKKSRVSFPINPSESSKKTGIPTKKQCSPAKTTSNGSPRKKPTNVSPRKKQTSPKKSRIKKIQSPVQTTKRHSPRKTGKSPVKRSLKNTNLRSSKQLKMDSFLNGKEDVPDEKPLVRSAHVNGNTSSDVTAEEIELSNESTANTDNGSIEKDVKTESKLMVRRKLRTRR